MSASLVRKFETGSIRRAETSDMDQIVDVHTKAFPDSFLTLLGPRFLTFYYRLLWSDPGGILLVHENLRRIDGFVAGFLRPKEFYLRMRKTRWAMLRSLAVALKDQPSLAGRVFYHVRRLMLGKTREHRDEAELSSLAVDPQAWGGGIGRSLVLVFLETAWSAGAHSIYLTTDATENTRTNLFYQRLGFQLRACFVQYRGRLLNEYVVHRNTK